MSPATSIPGISFHVCDLLQPEAVRLLLDRVRPDIIIHTACSDQGQNLDAISATACLLALQTAERDIRFIHVSSDHLFDGKNAPYSESHIPTPLTEYGKAKAQAENLISSLNPAATIVRTSILYDLDTPDRFFRRLLEAEEQASVFCLFTDEIRSSMWVENFAACLLELADRDYSGILHVGGPEPLSRWDLGMGLVEHFGLSSTAYIQKGTVQEAGLVRPKNLTLDSGRAQKFLSTRLLTFKEACEAATNL